MIEMIFMSIDLIVTDIMIILFSLMAVMWYIMSVGLSKFILVTVALMLVGAYPFYWIKGKIFNV